MGKRGDLGALDQPRTFLQEISEDAPPIELHAAGGRVSGKMRQAPLRLLAPLDGIGALALAAEAFAVEPPLRPADTGAAHLMSRVQDREAVDAARPPERRSAAPGAEGGGSGRMLRLRLRSEVAGPRLRPLLQSHCRAVGRRRRRHGGGASGRLPGRQRYCGRRGPGYRAGREDGASQPASRAPDPRRRAFRIRRDRHARRVAALSRSDPRGVL